MERAEMTLVVWAIEWPSKRAGPPPRLLRAVLRLPEAYSGSLRTARSNRGGGPALLEGHSMAQTTSVISARSIESHTLMPMLNRWQRPDLKMKPVLIAHRCGQHATL